MQHETNGIEWSSMSINILPIAVPYHICFRN